MKYFNITIIKLFGFVFGLLVLSFTSYETGSLVYLVTGSAVVTAIALVLFEGGFIYWAIVFKYEAEGLAQMAISLVASILDFLLIVSAVAVNLGAVSVESIDESLPAKIIVAGVLVNLTAKYTYSLTHPDSMQRIMERAAQGLVTMRMFKAFDEKARDVAEELAEELGQSNADHLREAMRLRNKRFQNPQTPLLQRPLFGRNGHQAHQPIEEETDAA